MGKKSGRIFTENDKQTVYRLFREGLTRKQIAVKLGIHYGTVVRWLQGLPKEKPVGGRMQTVTFAERAAIGAKTTVMGAITSG